MYFVKIDKSVSLYDLGIIEDLKLAAITNLWTGCPELYFIFENSRWLICQEGHRLAVDLDSLTNMLANGDINNISLYSENENYIQAENLLALLEKKHIRAFMMIVDDSKVKI